MEVNLLRRCGVPGPRVPPVSCVWRGLLDPLIGKLRTSVSERVAEPPPRGEASLWPAPLRARAVGY